MFLFQIGEKHTSMASTNAIRHGVIIRSYVTWLDRAYKGVS